MKNRISLFLLLALSQITFSQENKPIYSFEIHEEIDAPAWRKTKLALEKAEEAQAELVLLKLNTYGGRVDFADSIRTALLNSNIPTVVWIENNAASAGALISIACDQIYMKEGASIGAATVVDQDGTPAAEKYQSFFRSKMRATALANNRNPNIAEGMVDPKISIDGIADENTLITFTVEEAIKNGYCEGKANSLNELLSLLKKTNVKVIEHHVTTTEKIILFLISPTVSGILIMVLIGGLYFEIQAPGLGLAGLLALIAGFLLFIPLYLNDLMNNFELILLIVGILLILLEIFVIPGFGITGIAGIICFICGLAFSLVGTVPGDLGVPLPDFSSGIRALSLVLIACGTGIFLSIYVSKRILRVESTLGRKFVLATDQRGQRIQPDANTQFKDLVGQFGICETTLRPGGKVIINGKKYDAISEHDFIEKGSEIVVNGTSNSQLKVRRKSLS